jgi:DNA-binding protein H-NS
MMIGGDSGAPAQMAALISSRSGILAGDKGTQMKATSKRRKLSRRRPIIDIDQRELSIVARAPHEEAEGWQSMSVDDLWRLHEGIVAVITEKIQAEKHRLETRLKQLGATSKSANVRAKTKPSKEQKSRRPYPEVKPKFRDSHDPSVTWSGRGKLPRWLTQHLKSGKKIEDFKIE